MKESILELWGVLTPWERILFLRLLATILKERYFVPLSQIKNSGLYDPSRQEAFLHEMLSHSQFEIQATYQLTIPHNLMEIAFSLHKSGRISYHLHVSIEIVSSLFNKIEVYLGKYRLELAAYEVKEQGA